MTKRGEDANTKMVAWLALIVAFVALVIGGVAYQKQATMRPLNLGGQVDLTQAIKERQAVATAQSALGDLRKAVSSGAVQVSDVPARVTQIRNDLAIAFQGASSQSKTYWLGLDAQLAKIGLGLKAGTRTVLDDLDAAILSLKRVLQ